MAFTLFSVVMHCMTIVVCFSFKLNIEQTICMIKIPANVIIQIPCEVFFFSMSYFAHGVLLSTMYLNNRHGNLGDIVLKPSCTMYRL